MILTPEELAAIRRQASEEYPHESCGVIVTRGRRAGRFPAGRPRGIGAELRETRDMSDSKQLFEAATRLIPGGVNSPVRAFKGVGGEPFFVARGEGARIWDVDGRSYLDFLGSW